MVDLSKAQLHELYYYMRLTRSVEERAELLFKQEKMVGGLYRSLGQEGESVAAAYALEDGTGTLRRRATWVDLWCGA